MTHDSEKYRILNRDMVKLLAIATMTLNHFAGCFWEPSHPWYDTFLYIGYFTAAVMCYFLAEGYHYTHSKPRYAARLLVFALLSQIPFDLAFSHGKRPKFVRGNMLFTLLICFGLLVCMEYVRDRTLRILTMFVLIFAASYSDWGILAPLFVIFFEKLRGSRRKTAGAFLLAAVLDWGACFSSEIYYHGWGIAGNAVITGIKDCAGILAAGIVITFLYNGKSSEKSHAFYKWFFYIFYPLHLLIFGIIRVSLL